jgi:hypothetical protein
MRDVCGAQARAPSASAGIGTRARAACGALPTTCCFSGGIPGGSGDTLLGKTPAREGVEIEMILLLNHGPKAKARHCTDAYGCRREGGQSIGTLWSDCGLRRGRAPAPSWLPAGLRCGAGQRDRHKLYNNARWYPGPAHGGTWKYIVYVSKRYQNRKQIRKSAAAGWQPATVDEFGEVS